MITCSRCGHQVMQTNSENAGSANCPNCGMPLPTGNTALPAWLESLRADERPNPSTGTQPGFSTADLIDEGTLPGWMRSENTDMADNFSGKYPAMRRSSMPAPNTDGEDFPPKGIMASSLIDEQSLPSWLQEDRTGPKPVQGGLPASSLVQPDALPDWMKNLQPPPSPSAPRVEPGPPSQRIGANSLFDQQALPPWLSEQSSQPHPSYRPPEQKGRRDSAPRSGPSGLAGSSMLDMDALPNWLQESNQNRPGPEQIERPPSAQPGQSTHNGGNLAAASLIDMNALPPWLRTAEEQRQATTTGQLPPPAGASPRDALSGSNPNSAPSRPGAPHSPGFGTHPRIENVRVPSRPRGEVGPLEQSEVAANVFSSMLGVASSAPYFPSQQTGSAQYQGAAGTQQYFQGGQPPNSQAQSASSPYPPATNAPGSYSQMGYQVPGLQPGYAGPPPSPGAIPAGYSGGYPMGSQPGAPPQSPANIPGTQQQSTQTDHKRNAHPPGSHPAKRGIIETIRSWFSR